MKENSFSRRDFLKTIGLTSLATFLPFVEDSCQNHLRRPNVLLILTDDQGWGDITSHGNPLVDTPVMDRLAASGARFDRFYVSPVCAPTRASLLTGRYHSRSGVHGVTRGQETMRSEEVTIAEILRENGYATGCFGKWHNGAHFPNNPNGQGFDEFLGFCAGHWNNYFDTHLEYNGKMVETKGYIADVVTDAAIQFIQKNKNHPFFCYVPYNPPHSPFQVPDKYFNKYKSRGLDDTLAAVYGMIENLDDNLKRLLDTLKSLHLTGDTIVIFITDNGPNTDRFNGNMRGRKGSVHEGGSRVPCFICWPGHISPGRVIKKIAAHIDILPTLTNLLEIDPTDTLPLDGKSLVPLLTQENSHWENRMLFTLWKNRGAVRTQQFRLIVQGGKTELYNMIEDPGETEDVAKAKPQITARLKAEYDAWLKDVSQKGFDPIPTAIGYPGWPVVELPGHEAFLHAPGGKGISYVGKNGWANDWITNWTDTNAFPYWEIEIVNDGVYKITLLYCSRPQDTGVVIQVNIGGENLEGKIQHGYTPDYIPSPDRVKRIEVYEKTWASLPLGKIKLAKGRSCLTVKAISKPGTYVMELKAVRIIRVG